MNNDKLEFEDFIRAVNKYINKNSNEFRYPISTMTSLNSEKFLLGQQDFLRKKEEYLKLIEKLFDDKLKEMQELHNKHKI